MRILLLHDRITDASRADERDVLVQVEAIEKVLLELDHETERLDFSLNLDAVARELRLRSPDVVFNLVEAVEGHGRLIHLAPALLDALHIPYTGGGTEAIFLTASKLLTKSLLRLGSIPTPSWHAPSEPITDANIIQGEFIVKSVWEEASVGLDEDSVVRVDSLEALRREIDLRKSRLGGEAFAEAYVDGREFNLSLLASKEGFRLLPAAEICFENYAPDKKRVVGYRAKWVEDSFEYQSTTRRFNFPSDDLELIDELGNMAGRCWSLLGLEGYARVDFRVDCLGMPWVLEVNANPCLSPDAGFAAAAQRAGLSYRELVARILDDAG